jgi:DNA-binding transcriptional MerR regulator
VDEVSPPAAAEKSPEAFRTIREVSEALDVPQHVLRFWETRFKELKPLKRGGNRRYYRPDDVALAAELKRLLHEDGYTVKGVQRLLQQKGVRGLLSAAGPEAGDPRGNGALPDGRADSPPGPATDLSATAAVPSEFVDRLARLRNRLAHALAHPG